ncbi:hypothetical protein UCRPA7_5089 [Phaeoacremonium minimum UCRPA7]|uniref:Uncharacterized protein n=1 Tax=Phaeoacremonium minimum (strain UCR-PA7) TaxID=1286976 RepID=R8BJ52_PHAM7|nr:hypothetical protein UCRPA7_5089 [Phaeoacremonium minimum UCRPA7]EON99345.1 hypothetical protein UCRPA7_5089 [Phaeoacremonium minimum UCRPA7]
MKTGSKRKFGDENEQVKLASTVSEKGKEDTVPMVKPLAIRDLKNRRSIKDLSSARQPSKEKLGNSATSGPQRKPLAAKSTNDDLSSPKKSTKPSPVDDPISKPNALKVASIKEQPKDKKKQILRSSVQIHQNLQQHITIPPGTHHHQQTYQYTARRLDLVGEPALPLATLSRT